jgi:hypothetical protein
MKTIFLLAFRAFSVFFVVLFLFSCAALPSRKSGVPQPAPQPTPEILPVIPPQPPVEPVIPDIPRPFPPEEIMGKGLVSKENLAAFLLGFNTQIEPDFVKTLSLIYVEEALIEGVNHDIAYAQMCLETGFLRYGGLVTPDMNNFCGLGATGLPGPDGLPQRGLVFPDPRTGVRAHIQHLKGYASAESLNQGLVNPRYEILVRIGRIGSAPTIHGLTGTWATDPMYSNKIAAILDRLYEFSFPFKAFDRDVLSMYH